MAAICPGINLPPCKNHRLVEVAELVASALSSVSHREKLALALKKEGHIPKLLKLFQICEELQLRWALQHLSAIVQGILWLHQAALLEVMLSQECLMDVVRCLEYGPSLAQPKWQQQLLQKTTKPKELLPIQDPELQQNFHQAYWAQYIQVVILAKATGLGEGSLPSLTSFISCKKEEIFHVWEVNFLKDFCAFSVMFHQKGEAFLQSLAKLGLLPALEILLGMDDLQVASAATDTLSCQLLSIPGPRICHAIGPAEGPWYQPHPCAHAMMLCHHAAAFERANQVMELLQTLLDPENHLATAEVSKILGFFNSFYSLCLPVLTPPLLANAATGALHFLRKIIGLKDELYTRSITQGNLLAPLVQALLDSGAASNLLHWAVLELFEFLRLEDCKSLLPISLRTFILYWNACYVQTYQGLKRETSTSKAECAQRP